MQEVTSTSEIKLCINCKHIGTNASGNVDTYKCFAPQNPSDIDLVSGQKIYKMQYCRDHRNLCAVTLPVCSVSAKWFEQRPATPAIQPISKQALKIKLNSSCSNLLEDLGL